MYHHVHLILVKSGSGGPRPADSFGIVLTHSNLFVYLADSEVVEGEIDTV